jgi:hypothetical protein
MSYLDPPRLHFVGKFAATISTVNNDPAHFDNATFKQEYQQRQDGSVLNGWFNPRGDGDWRLMGCKVAGAVMQDGSAVTDDPVLSCLVADSDRLPPAKLVDLDSEQQLVSTIWGLEMRICDASGENLLRAPFEPAAFMDIWTRSIGSDGGGDNSAAAMYQSVLYDLEWGRHVSSSPFLTELMKGAADGRLSVKFNVDGINLNWNDPDFLRGRITGTIGVAHANEPTHFVRGRQLVFDPFVPDEPPTWRGSLHPIFQQYANLYPLMADIVNLADYDSVCEMREMLLLAFEQPISSPNSMPATRDLSHAKRTAILRWLRTLGPDGKPLRGSLPSPVATGPVPRARRLAAVLETADGGAAGLDPTRGGKAIALARRLAFDADGRPSR